MAQAEEWRWDAGEVRASRWDRVVTLSQDCAAPIIRLLEIPGAFVPGASQALERARANFRSDLSISNVHNPACLRPLSGLKVLRAKSGDHPVFLEGFEASFTLSHDGRGSEPIVLERMDLALLDHTPGEDPYYRYQVEGEEIFGAGPIEPQRFFVEVGPKGPRPARKVIDRRTNETAEAHSNNFFDTDPEIYLGFTPGETPQMIKVTTTVLEPGSYELCFRFFYRVANRELRQHTTDAIHVYLQD